MDKFEYKLINSREIEKDLGVLKGRSRQAVENYLNQLGREGWEIVALQFDEFSGKETEFIGLAKKKYF
jgi:hypothetical protein